MKFRVGDGLWMRPVDVGAALAARSYAGDGELVLEVSDAFCPWNDGRYGLDGSKTTASPDLRLTVDALGTVYLGGFTFSDLLRAGRVEEVEGGRRRPRRCAFPHRPEAVVPRDLLGICYRSAPCFE